MGLACFSLAVGRPAGAQSTVQMLVEVPPPNSAVLVPFLVTGWALDTAAAADAGVNAVQVWVFPLVGGAPVLLGDATLGISRQDLATTLGGQFGRAGFQLVAQVPLATRSPRRLRPGASRRRRP